MDILYIDNIFSVYTSNKMAISIDFKFRPLFVVVDLCITHVEVLGVSGILNIVKNTSKQFNH